uniref:Serine-threonine kinase receptor-associated protein n=1 Tax=Eptatretus burgeri TaxID=7764 RepID=A0A8C4R664_EPTBU
MKPILLQGHERSITQIKYNRDGDLLFSCAKDQVVNVWYSLNGERLGSYNGHTGAVWCVDVDWDTKKVLTGAADNTCRLWDCETGKKTNVFDTKSAVRTCGFDFSGNIIMFSTDKQMGYDCLIHLFDMRDSHQITQNEPYLTIPCKDSKVTSAVWGSLGEYIVVGLENGQLLQYSKKLNSPDLLAPSECRLDSGISSISFKLPGYIFHRLDHPPSLGLDSNDRAISLHPSAHIMVFGDFNVHHKEWLSGEILMQTKEHIKQVNDLQTSQDLTMVITASKDTTAKLFDIESLDLLKTYKTERPVNSAAISPIQNHVVLGGGQEAMDVTTTSTRIGKFEARSVCLIMFLCMSLV